MWNCKRQHLKGTATMNCYSTKSSYLARTRELQNMLPIHRNAPVTSTSVQKLFFHYEHPWKWVSFIHQTGLIGITKDLLHMAINFWKYRSLLQDLAHVCNMSHLQVRFGKDKNEVALEILLQTTTWSSRLSTWRSNSDVWGTAAVLGYGNREWTETATTPGLERTGTTFRSVSLIGWDTSGWTRGLCTWSTDVSTWLSCTALSKNTSEGWRSLALEDI